MKNKVLLPLLFIIGVALAGFWACEKNNKLPVLSTNKVKSINSTSVICSGNVSNDGGLTITEKGVCWSTNQFPTINDGKVSNGSGVGSFTCTINNLIPFTVYFVRAYAINEAVISYGNQIRFRTKTAVTVNDIEGNIYNTTVIDSDLWMAENLQTTTYNDSNPISLVADFNAWKSLTTPAYCWYNNDEELYKDTYGALYNWYVANSGKVCPSGWHVPTNGEWYNLIQYLGGTYVAGGKMRESDTIHWAAPNSCATNESNFESLPGGTRCVECASEFYGMRTMAFFWASGYIPSDWQWGCQLNSFCGIANKGVEHHNNGQSIRCIKDK